MFRDDILVYASIVFIVVVWFWIFKARQGSAYEGWERPEAAFGAYLFGAPISLRGILQRNILGVPTHVFQAAPFALMIPVLLFVSRRALERLLSLFPPRIRRVLREALRVARA